MRIYSVSEYREEINELMSQVTVVIEGEITSLNISQNRFVWFSLSDNKCLIDCFMMTFALKVQLAEGMRIRVTGSPTMFKKGKVVFQPRKVELVGDGDLQKAFELLKAQLEKEGLFDESRKRSVPQFPVHIGLLTSRDAAAYTDVLKVIANRWPLVRITLAHAQVQGDSAPSSIVAGLRALYAQATITPFDCIVITRGGGSAEDLQAFNAEEVVRAVFQSPVPTISAVGHERDTTLIDFVADVRAATPSNAAELLTPHIDDVMQNIEQSIEHAASSVRHRVAAEQVRVDSMIRSMAEHVRAPIARMEMNAVRINHAREMIRQQIEQVRARLAGSEKLIQEMHPERLLQRGYTITRDQSGAIVRSADAVASGDELSIQLADGKIPVRAT